MRRLSVSLASVVMVFAATTAWAQKSASDGIAEYRAMLQDGKAFFAKKEVKVTLGGCGG